MLSIQFKREWKIFHLPLLSFSKTQSKFIQIVEHKLTLSYIRVKASGREWTETYENLFDCQCLVKAENCREIVFNFYFILLVENVINLLFKGQNGETEKETRKAH